MLLIKQVMLLCSRAALCFVLLLLPLSSYAQIEITDSHGKYRFAKPPERVVVLNWALAEQMIELGEVPLGVADVEGYRRHAGHAALPDSVLDVGERLSPSLSEIKALKPEIIVIGYSQRSLLRPLSNIAKVIYFKNFGKRYNNQEKSRDRFLELAKLFDKTEFAENKLKEREARLGILRQRLQDAYVDNSPPAVQFIVPDVSNAAKSGASLVFGANSMPFYAAQALGLTVLAPQESDQFGMSQLTSAQLDELVSGYEGDLCQFNLLSYSQGVTSEKGKESEENPESGGHCVGVMDYQNSFGGIMSILYLAESIVDGLLGGQQL